VDICFILSKLQWRFNVLAIQTGKYYLKPNKHPLRHLNGRQYNLIEQSIQVDDNTITV